MYHLDPDPNIFSKQDTDPELETHSMKVLDPDPQKVKADPKHWF
jgi:hypothetical protein